MTTETRFYNTDPRYEMMLAILPDPQFENLPDAKEVVADLKEIVRLCHHYTIDDDTPNERAAWELAHAIINHLLVEWGTHKTEDLAAAACEYWNPPAPVQNWTPVADATPETPVSGDTPDDGLLIP